MKIFIQDLVSQFQNGHETELSTGSVIRFDDGKKAFQVSINDDGDLVIHGSHPISVKPKFSNVVHIS